MRTDKQDKDMILDEKVMIFIVLASEIFQKRSSAIFKKHGLTFSQYNVLKYLGACEGGWNRVGNVGKHMLVTGANVTGLAKRMQKAGLIERKNDTKDERLTILHITSKGTKALEEIRKLQENHIAEYLNSCPQPQKEQILSVLKHIVRKGKQMAGGKPITP
jgi:DNA-binding MarR family transcriptional regulator